MQSKFYLASFITCFFVLNSFAQKQNVYFLKNDGRYVKLKDSADYVRIVREPDSGTMLYNVLDYYLNGKPKMLAKSSTIDPVRLEGMTISYYPDGNRKQVANYAQGKTKGLVYDYYPNSKLYRIEEHTPIDQMPNYIFDENVIAVYDSTGTQTVKEGTGHYRFFNSDSKTFEEEGDLKNGKKTGTWKGIFNSGKINTVEEYANGKFIKGTSTDENEKNINYTVKEALPTFKGGESAFGNYLSRTIKYPILAKHDHIQGRVVVSFVVETDGHLTDFKILYDIGGGCGEEAIRVLKQSPKWNSGLQHGMPVRVAYTMPINFTLADR